MCDDIDRRAIELVGIVHGDGSDRDVLRLVRHLSPHQLIGLAISCAAMVNPDQTQTELLAWMNPIRASRAATTARPRA